ncbi:HAMP domain-containing histidine kinase [Roseibacterium sp. SDUM158016]|uniref:sensor histidine kinase n=1 Tax=Roseicyclus sediminis TaxID=2980997 RepID=UPI0021D0CA57|nr:HAMP domain-containing sensor histidine kinase [Roseibacterium sp. SDUM158016]MCU4654104.1 HAMP domain-containing histidine kinase [Roseibacterium sp. SDUM158016]
MVNSLSGRFLILTVIFVMLAEVFIFVPSVARYREDYLLARLERAQIASLALLATDGMIDDDLEAELLNNAEVLNVVLLRDATRQLILSSDHMTPIARSFDLREPSAWTLIRDAMRRLVTTGEETIRVIGQPVNQAGLLIEITMPSGPLRDAMIDYGLRILLLSAIISIFTATLLFVAVQRLLVLPIKRVVGHMTSYAEAPDDASRIIEPRGSVRELREAETALQSLQTQLTGALRQRERLAQLGEAVAKISHDLRNILSVTTLMADRLEGSNDPTVQRTTPKILASLTRAVNLTEATLAFGRAEEPAPKLDRVKLADIAEDVVENERLSGESDCIAFVCEVPATLVLRADPEQLHRVLSNLVRNARQAIAAQGGPGEIAIRGLEDGEGWRIEVSDTGPGLPQKALDHLFKPFHGGARKGGSGLGLAIAAEIMRGHGGRLELVKTGPEGTTFALHLPKGLAA